MKVELAPVAGEPEFGDRALVGEWADELPKMIAQPQTPPWCSYAVRIDKRVEGTGGFKGAPDDNGWVEIGYLTLARAEGRGVAKAVAAALLDIAREHGATGVLAHTLPEHNASTRVLAANGFALIGPVEDPEDGTVWRWERTL